ncbi:hypothetical protein C5E43_13990 [Nocardia cyriacigeorgica]|nr:hypothetical protein C5E43_13990 [Nocardia cyriacigeorgica]
MGEYRPVVLRADGEAPSGPPINSLPGDMRHLIPEPPWADAPSCKRLHRITIRRQSMGNTLDSDSEPREVHR